MTEAPKTRLDATLWRLENDLGALRHDLTIMLEAQRAIILCLLTAYDLTAEEAEHLRGSEAAIERLLAIPGRAPETS